MSNHYEVLGIDSNFPQERIPQAFRIKIKQVHPDKNIQNEQVDDTKDMTIRLYEAYKVLNDPSLRR